MKIYIIIPAHNEQDFIAQCLNSVITQSTLPDRVCIVNDHCSDETENIVKSYDKVHSYISYVNLISSEEHLPGSKIVQAFYKGLDLLDEDFDIILKLDADIMLPKNYLESIALTFKKNPKAGIVGGFAYELDNGKWKLNHPMGKKHVRGAFKAYSKQCFQKIGGLKSAMGWDTVDELLSIYHGFEVVTIDSLHLKHLRAVSSAYNKKARQLQGKAMYSMDYGLCLSFIASIKMAYKQNKRRIIRDNIVGYIKALNSKTPKIVSKKEGRFIRTYRYNNIFNKLMT